MSELVNKGVDAWKPSIPIQMILQIIWQSLQKGITEMSIEFGLDSFGCKIFLNAAQQFLQDILLIRGFDEETKSLEDSLTMSLEDGRVNVVTTEIAELGPSLRVGLEKSLEKMKAKLQTVLSFSKTLCPLSSHLDHLQNTAFMLVLLVIVGNYVRRHCHDQYQKQLHLYN